MKKIILFVLALIFCTFSNTQAATTDYLGRWAEETSERVVMDIFQKDDNNYQIYITWREDNLAQKDIYRFSAQNNKGILKYNKGIHIYRYFEKNGEFQDKLDYNDGFGEIILKDDKIIWKDNKDKTTSVFIKANKNLIKDTTASNRNFSILLPEEFRGIYEVKTSKDTISIYHKASKKAGFGGFAFAYRIYEHPKDHANLPGGVKVGEFKIKNKLYDMVLKYPTDVQYDYTKSTKPPEDFAQLYDFGSHALIFAKNKNQYFKNQGMKGFELYQDVLKKHIQAIKEKWNSNKLEQENMSYMYNVVSKKNIWNKIGYAFYDVNMDGIEELFIGEITNNKTVGIIYDIYTMVDRKPTHVISGGNRDRYFISNDTFIANEFNGGALEFGTFIYNLVENSTELFPQLGYKYDAYENKKNPYFISYSSNLGEWENYSFKEYKERTSIFKNYKNLNSIPLKNLLDKN